MVDGTPGPVPARDVADDGTTTASTEVGTAPRAEETETGASWLAPAAEGTAGNGTGDASDLSEPLATGTAADGADADGADGADADGTTPDGADAGDAPATSSGPGPDVDTAPASTETEDSPWFAKTLPLASPSDPDQPPSDNGAQQSATATPSEPATDPAQDPDDLFAPVSRPLPVPDPLPTGPAASGDTADPLTPGAVTAQDDGDDPVDEDGTRTPEPATPEPDEPDVPSGPAGAGPATPEPDPVATAEEEGGEEECAPTLPDQEQEAGAGLDLPGPEPVLDDVPVPEPQEAPEPVQNLPETPPSLPEPEVSPAEPVSEPAPDLKPTPEPAPEAATTPEASEAPSEAFPEFPEPDAAAPTPAPTDGATPAAADAETEPAAWTDVLSGRTPEEPGPEKSFEALLGGETPSTGETKPDPDPTSVLPDAPAPPLDTVLPVDPEPAVDVPTTGPLAGSAPPEPPDVLPEPSPVSGEQTSPAFLTPETFVYEGRVLEDPVDTEPFTEEEDQEEHLGPDQDDLYAPYTYGEQDQYAQVDTDHPGLPVLWNEQIDLTDPAYFSGVAVARDGTLYSVSEHAVQRRARQTKAFLVMLGIVVMIGVGGLVYWKGFVPVPGDSRTSATPCPTASPIAAPMKGTRVNIYNSTDRAGLANQVAQTLRKRGFVITDVGNDPFQQTVEDAAVIRYGPDTQLMAKTVAAQVNGKVELLEDEARLEMTVDLIIGPKFKKLRTVKEVTPLLQPSPAPSPKGCEPVVTPSV